VLEENESVIGYETRRVFDPISDYCLRSVGYLIQFYLILDELYTFVYKYAMLMSFSERNITDYV
jgi:hypothetical protein